jgi:chemotaxis protein MotB
VGSQEGEIRIVKKKRGHGGHHGGAWKVAYADFVTAMMAFFLVMWITNMSPTVKEAVAAYFKDPIAFNKAVEAGKAPFKVAESSKSILPDKSGKPELAERQRLKQTKERIEKQVAETPEFRSIKQHVDVQLVNEGLRIDLLENKESLFFDSASAKIKPSTRHLLALITRELRKLPNRVIIEGHTDSRPLARNDGYTNWELSADRANAARQVMEFAGMQTTQIAQVRGYAATQPRNPKDPTHFSNRRVSIIVVMKDAMKLQQFGNGGLDLKLTPAQSPGG